MKKSILALSTLFLMSATLMNAYADQCSYITAESAKTAAKLIKLSQKNAGGILEICQPCGEANPTKTVATTVTIGRTGVEDVPSEILVNGDGIDLAYAYVAISPKTWVNLAMLSGCAAQDVSQFILESRNRADQVTYKMSAKY